MSNEQISQVSELSSQVTEGAFVREFAKIYDLENRTLLFAKSVISFVNVLERTIGNKEVGKQLVRSAGSVSQLY